MKRLNLNQMNQLKDCLGKLKDAENDLRKYLVDLQERVEVEWNLIIVPKIEALNTAKDEAAAFVAAVQEAMESYLDARSDEWRDSDTGVAFQEWKTEWDVELSEIEIDEPYIPSPDDYDLPSETLEGLPEMVEA